MYLCYIDESGTPDLPGNTSHFVLAGLAIPIWKWKNCDADIETLKRQYGLEDVEIHVAWLLRRYLEQSRIPNFDALEYRQRRAQVESLRNVELLRLQRVKNPQLLRQTKKNYKETASYIHLTYAERRAFALEIARCIARWGFARLFAECIDKVHFSATRSARSVDEQAFEQVVSRFEQYLQITSKGSAPSYGLLIHDNNQTVAKKHTDLMKKFHQQGTFWTLINNIIETPLFVDSKLTSMVQVADVCGYALRRYLENHEEELFNVIFDRADRKDGIVVGVRHFTKPNACSCRICNAHKQLGGQ